MHPVNEHYRNPKTAADWLGNIELNWESEALYHKYYKLALDYKNQKQFNKDNVYLKGSDIKDFYMRNYIIKDIFGSKISSAGLDSMDVVVPQYNSPLVKKFLKSFELKWLLNENYKAIKAGQWENKAIPIHLVFKPQLILSIGGGLLYNLRIKDGDICGSLIDYYNFKSGFGIYNSAYEQQESGNLTNYLLIFPIRLPVDETIFFRK